jgi:hypothetical protein
MLLSQTIDTIDHEINQLIAQIEAKKQHMSQLIELDSLTDNVLEQLGNIVSKIQHHAPEATTSLRETVLSLFNDEGGDSDNGNQPTPPAPDTNPVLEIETQETEQQNHQSDEQPADSYTELVQHPDNLALAYQNSFDGESVCVYIGCNNQSRLKSWSEWIYRQDWGLTRQETYTINPAIHLNFKHELKLPPLPSIVLHTLVANNYSQPPILPPEKLSLIPDTEPRFKLDSHLTCSSAPAEAFQVRSETSANANQAKPIIPDATAVPKEAISELENLEAGDVIGSLLVPNWTYKVIELKANHKVQCERILSSGQSFRVELDVSAVYLIEKASQSQKAEQGTAESGTERETVVNTPEESTLVPNEKQEHHLEPSPDSLVPLSAAPSSSITAEDLAERLRESKSWKEVEAVATANEQHKRAAWRLLSPEEQNQVLVLKLQAKQEENQSEICAP